MVSRQANQSRTLRTSNRQIMLVTRKLLLFDGFGTVGSVAGDSGWRGLKFRGGFWGVLRLIFGLKIPRSATMIKLLHTDVLGAELV